MQALQKITTLCAFAFAAILFAPQALAQSDRAYRTEIFPVSGIPELIAETSGASVKVIGTNDNEIVVRMYARYRGDLVTAPNKEVEEFLEDFKIEIEGNQNEVRLSAKNTSWGWNWGDQKVSIAFEVEVPREIETSFQTSGGSISLTGVDGDHQIATSGGSITITDVKGQVTTKSSGGSFTLSNFEGEVEVRTSGGSVKVSEMRGELEVYTSGGSVSLDEIYGSIGAYTSGGSIRANLNEITDDLEFKSSGGSVSVTVPATAELDLDLRGGRVNTELKNFSGTIDDDKVSGQLNGGGYALVMQSSGGRLTLDFSR
ncbi:DUF4097 domain-containing protein [Algoriphagus namhaensis]|uniref:DUF4097 domain-containing protein n=1 Tax=Algoriphagus namhaensis TaxID=915353 RepID=A0ABV8AWU7_9BACT